MTTELTPAQRHEAVVREIREGYEEARTKHTTTAHHTGHIMWLRNKCARGDISEYDMEQQVYWTIARHVEAETARLREALEFYATSWETHPGDSGPGGNTPQEPVCDPDAALIEDGGAKARAALAATQKKETK